jgi:hypothetical protein
MPGVVSHLLKKKKKLHGFKSAKKRWRDDFATGKRQKDGFGVFRKETGCHPASSRPTSSTVEAIHFSGTLVTTCKTARRRNPEDHNTHFYHRENLKSHNLSSRRYVSYNFST